MLDELLGSLLTYEMNFKYEEERNKALRGETTKKSFALKAIKEENEKIIESDEKEENDEEVALLTRKFIRFLRSKQKRSLKKKLSKGLKKKKQCWLNRTTTANHKMRRKKEL